MGLLVGAAFLTRAPLAFAGPVLALWVVPSWSDVARRRPKPGRPGPGAALGRLAVADRGRRTRPGVLLLVQPRPLRLRHGVRLRAGDAPGVAGAAAPEGPVRAGPRGDEPELPVPQAAGVHEHVPVPPAGRAGHVRAVHEPGAAAGPAGAVAGPADVAAAAGGGPGADPHAALLRRRLAAVRLPLLPGLHPVRVGAGRDGGREARARCRGGAGRSSSGAC